MSRLLICAPLAIEARAIRRGLPAGTPDAIVIRTGLGIRRARRAGPALRSLRDCDALVVAGFGGALDKALRPGDVLVATEILFEDRRLPCVATDLLVWELTRAGVHTQTGPLITTGHLVRAAERRRLSHHGARAVDMEAGPLVASAPGLPTAVVRAIVDTPGRPLPSPATLTGGLAARRSLRRIGPALLSWLKAVEAAQVPPPTSPRSPTSRRDGRSS